MIKKTLVVAALAAGPLTLGLLGLLGERSGSAAAGRPAPLDPVDWSGRRTPAGSPPLADPGPPLARAPSPSPALDSLSAPIPSDALVGRVVDEAGAPCRAFTLIHRPVDEPGPSGGPRRVEGRMGAFFVDGLAPGTHELWAEVGTAWFSPLARVELPLTEPVRLVAPRPARLAGRVVGPDGRAAAEVAAQLRCSVHPDRRYRDVEISGRDGSFTFQKVPAHAFRLELSSRLFQSDGDFPFDLESGEVREGVRLRMPIGQRITGELRGVRDASRERVLLRSANGSETILLTPDAEGRFSSDWLPPILFSVGLADRRGELDVRRASMGRTLTRVLLSDGESPHVVLDAMPAQPLPLSGRILRAGEPVAGARVAAWSPARLVQEPDFTLGESDLAFAHVDGLWLPHATSLSDDQGRYALLLDGGGPISFAVGREGAFAWFDVDIDVEAADAEGRLVRDFHLPSGRVTGRVEGPRGDPAAEARLLLRRSPPDPAARVNEWRARSTWEGEFAFENLLPGPYRVCAIDTRGRPDPATDQGLLVIEEAPVQVRLRVETW